MTAGPTFLAEYDINPTTGKMPSLNVNIEGYVKDFTFEAYVKVINQIYILFIRLDCC